MAKHFDRIDLALKLDAIMAGLTSGPCGPDPELHADIRYLPADVKLHRMVYDYRIARNQWLSRQKTLTGRSRQAHIDALNKTYETCHRAGLI